MSKKFRRLNYHLRKKTCRILRKVGWRLYPTQDYISLVLEQINKLSPDYKVLTNCLQAELEYQKSRRNCIHCKESFARYHCVCERHYHDYQDCGSNECWTCLVGRSLGDEW